MALLIWRLDYAGIAVLIVTSFYPPVYYGFMCQPAWAAFYLSVTTLLGVGAGSYCRLGGSWAGDGARNTASCAALICLRCAALHGCTVRPKLGRLGGAVLVLVLVLAGGRCSCLAPGVAPLSSPFPSVLALPQVGTVAVALLEKFQQPEWRATRAAMFTGGWAAEEPRWAGMVQSIIGWVGSILAELMPSHNKKKHLRQPGHVCYRALQDDSWGHVRMPALS